MRINLKNRQQVYATLPKGNTSTELLITVELIAELVERVTHLEDLLNRVGGRREYELFEDAAR